MLIILPGIQQSSAQATSIQKCKGRLCNETGARTLRSGLSSLLLVAGLLGNPALAAVELSDQALGQEVETNHAMLDVPEVLDCDKSMSEAECNRLQYENYANQTDRSYSEFLRTETTNPLRNRVIKQPLLTQPAEKPATTPEQRQYWQELIRQTPPVPNAPRYP